MLEFGRRPKESTGLCLVPLTFQLLEFAGRPKESTGLCPVPLTFQLLEFAGRPKESTRLCLVPLRTKNPLGFAWYPLGQKSGCTRFIHVSQPDLKPLSYLNIPIVHPRASDARASAYTGYDRSVICPALACVWTALAVGGFVGGFAALSRRLLDKA